MAGGRRGVPVGHVAPLRAGAQDPEDPIQHLAVVAPRPAAAIRAARVLRDRGREDCPLFVREIHGSLLGAIHDANEDHCTSTQPFVGPAHVTRTAAFAGVALVWAFRANGQPISAVPTPLVPAALFFAVGILCDVLQYVAATVVWLLFHWHHEHRTGHEKDPELDHSIFLPLPMHLLFVFKIVAVGCGYGVVVKYLWGAWFQQG